MNLHLLGIATFYLGCNTELEQSTEELQAENNDLQADVAALTNMVIELQTNVELLQSEHDSHTTRFDALNNSVDEILTTVNTLEYTVQSLEEEMASLNTTLLGYPTNADMATYVAENAPTMELFSDLEMRTFDIETTIGLHSSDLQTLQTSLTGIDGKVQPLTGNYTTLENTVLTLNVDISNIEGDVQTLGTTVSTLASDVQNNSSDLTTLESTVEDNTNTLESNTLLLEDIDDAVVTLESRAGQTPIEAGTILIWSGALSNIPTGWTLCDGTNGTPDLTDRFVVGAGSSYAVEAVGGSTSSSISSTARAVSPCQDNLPNFSCNMASALIIKTVSGGSSLPPYSALAYIMKL